MAAVYPANIEKLRFSTYGEKKASSLLSKLPDDCTIRYEMVIGERNRRPDFTVFSPQFGVAIVEVKDWGIDYIQGMSEEAFQVGSKFHPEEGVKNYMNPELKCMLYLRDVKEHLSSSSLFRDDRNRITIPVNYILILTNISRGAFLASGMKKYISPNRALFKDDSKNAEIFLSRFSKLFPPLKTPLDDFQLNKLREVLQPDLVFRTAANPFDDDYLVNKTENKNELSTYILSPEQEEIAKNLGEGPRLLRGIAGTGKTMILLYSAKLKAASNPQSKILVLCWNTSLATYMQQTYQRISIPEKGKTTVINFSRLILKLMNDCKIEYPGTFDDEAIDILIKELANYRLDKYDAVFVDEGQDFRKEWLEFIFNNLIYGKPSERNFVIAADGAQRLYEKRAFSWSEIGIPMVGRSKILRAIYRNAAKVWLFAHLLLGEESGGIAEIGEEIKDKLVFASQGEYDPLLIDCKDDTGQIEKIIEIINGLKSNGISPGSVLILYNKKGNGFPVDQLIGDLTAAGISSNWITEHKYSRRDFNWEGPSVKISTTASAKGMDAPVVIVAGAERYGSSPNSYHDDLKLMYVALTRAREVLIVLHSGQGPLINRLDYAYKRYSELEEIITKEKKEKKAS